MHQAARKDTVGRKLVRHMLDWLLAAHALLAATQNGAAQSRARSAHRPPRPQTLGPRSALRASRAFRAPGSTAERAAPCVPQAPTPTAATRCSPVDPRA